MTRFTLLMLLVISVSLCKLKFDLWIDEVLNNKKTKTMSYTPDVSMFPYFKKFSIEKLYVQTLAENKQLKEFKEKAESECEASAITNLFMNQIDELKKEIDYNKEGWNSCVVRDSCVVRENRVKFDKVVQAVDSLNHFLEISIDKGNIVHYDSFIDELWDAHWLGSFCGYRQYTDHEDAIARDDPDYEGYYQDDWLKACPFKYWHEGQGEYSHSLRKLEWRFQQPNAPAFP